VEGVSAPAATVYLLDSSMYVFRAWHSMPDQFVDVDGAPVNAVHGFAQRCNRDRHRRASFAAES
jgi:5'-3' exonuclease